MKKTLIAFAALSAIAGVAQAQSTVTLYGLLDANIGSYKGNVISGATTTPAFAGRIGPATQAKIDSSGLNGSRFGMRIREDLGGGLAAVGNLEAGINLDDGSSAQGRLFGRRANVGLSGGFGTVTIGRNSSSYDDVSGDHTMMAQTIFDPSNVNNGLSSGQAAAIGTLAGAQPFLNRNTTWLGYNTRFNNSVKYISPNFGGFSGSAMYAFGEDKTTGIGGLDASKTVSANLKFANGPLVVSGGYQREQSGSTIGTAIANPNAAGGKPALENTLLSVAYDLGVAKLGAGFSRAKYKNVSAPAILGGGAFAAQKEFSLSAAVPLGAATVSATVARSQGDTLGKSTGVGIQALYSLSKRTTLYAGALNTKQYDRLARAIVNTNPGSNVSRVNTYAAGVRHTF